MCLIKKSPFNSYLHNSSINYIILFPSHDTCNNKDQTVKLSLGLCCVTFGHSRRHDINSQVRHHIVFMNGETIELIVY